MLKEQVLTLETGQPKKTFGTRKKQDQMRLVALQSGELRHANASFARALGLTPDDLVGRNILDIILFKNPDELRQNRPLFNIGGDDETSGLQGLEAGPHIILLGRYQKPYNFYFDWVRGHDGKKYLIASSIKEDKPEEWTHFNEEMKSPAEMQKRQSKYRAPVSGKPNHGRFLKPANDRSQTECRLLNAHDTDIFSSMDNDFMCVIDTNGTIKRYNTHFELQTKRQNRNTILDIFAPEDKAHVWQMLQSLQTYEAASLEDKGAVEFEARMKTDSAQSFWMRWTVSPYGEELYCLGQDITAAKLNESALQRHERELSEAQALAHLGH